MTKTDTINSLIKSISEIQSTPRKVADCSESGNRKFKNQAQAVINASDLNDGIKQQINSAIGNASNSSGRYYSNNGIKAGLDALRAVLSELGAKDKAEATQATNSGLGLNLHNLRNLVSDGSIFYVDFIKRTTGERRMMVSYWR